MFYSQGLLSSKGPLGAIWVAAYCFKRLKKAQVKETDISSSVDKILQDELDVVTYRVLAYLLLGVVRIYSKKVEYLFHDCNEVLTEIKKFVVKTKDNMHMETLRAHFNSITLPDKFELDAFDLEILEDVIGGNIAHHEEITLKDGSSKKVGIGQCSLDKFHYEEFDDCPNTYTSDYTMVENVLQSHFMDINFEIRTPYSPIDSHEGKEKLQDCISSQQHPANVDILSALEEERTGPFNLFSKENQTNEKQKEVPEKAGFEDQIHGEVSMEKLQCCRISEEESVDIEMFCGRQEESVVNAKPINKNNQFDGERINAPKLGSSENNKHQAIGEDNAPRDIELDISSAKEDPQENFQVSVEKDHNTGKTEFQNVISNEDGKCAVTVPESTTLDGFSQPKFPDAAGGSTPEFMLIPTPAASERPRFSRKRRCVFDELIVLPNEVLKKRIHDASDLVTKRRNSPHNLLAAWRASCICGLPQGFFEPLIPCHSVQLHSLFSSKKTKISESVEAAETPEKLDVLDSPNVELPSVFLRKKLKILKSVKIVTTPEKLDVLDSLHVSKTEHMPASPETPLLYSTRSTERSPESPKSSDSDKVRPDSFGSIEKEQSVRKDEELNYILTNEDINSCESENAELNGWSGRTRAVARYLHKTFMDMRKQREEEVVNLLRVTEGKTKKESARLFYELLVLRTTGYLDTEQDNAYGDVLVQKLAKWDQTFSIGL